jgi:hypothetical protein
MIRSLCQPGCWSTAGFSGPDVAVSAVGFTSDLGMIAQLVNQAPSGIRMRRMLNWPVKVPSECRPIRSLPER